MEFRRKVTTSCLMCEDEAGRYLPHLLPGIPLARYYETVDTHIEEVGLVS